MLREQLWFDFCDDLPIEIEQRIDEGILEAERFKERAEQVKEMPRGAARTAAGAELLEQLCALENPQDKDEPSDLPGIKAASVGEPKEKAEADCDKIYGAWLGRCAGCLLGQPVEGWRRARINGLLKETGNLPLQNYISSDIGPVLREKYNVRDDGHAYGAEKTGWINNVSYMPEDDDTNYTLIALKLVEQYGRDFTPDDAAENWLMNLPLLHLCTAERVAYINLAQSVFPPESAAVPQSVQGVDRRTDQGRSVRLYLPGRYGNGGGNGMARCVHLSREKRHLRRNVDRLDACESGG